MVEDRKDLSFCQLSRRAILELEFVSEMIFMGNGAFKLQTIFKSVQGRGKC